MNTKFKIGSLFQVKKERVSLFLVEEPNVLHTQIRVYSNEEYAKIVQPIDIGSTGMVLSKKVVINRDFRAEYCKVLIDGKVGWVRTYLMKAVKNDPSK